MDKISSAYNSNFKRSEQPVTIQQACTGGETVLVIQDNVPWCGASNAEGAVMAELIAQGISYCIINSSQIGTTDLSQFRDIIIPSDQSQTFYNNLFPNGNIHPDIEDYIRQGGILSANLADLGWDFGSWEAYSFVGGLTHVSTETAIITLPIRIIQLLRETLLVTVGTVARF
ncbi:hypothetical protein J7E38_14485 [Bacillus sp. ISL-35]|uniref:hypothetical protein n=1 Tax=Bacillus sp. ISL-35 TaxID=2819122 RepID=UPI001BE7D577|nr:hypothetical protein [Bacillus sp. ISL-35]MBT2680217.1 hypothetical protein [Bacillus sp. ISL-35]MBT2704493.1 hypothetical protein [Chryseobacterium sp. ISL-80]